MKVFILLLLFPLSVFGKAEIDLTEVKVDCQVSEFCHLKRQRFSNLIGEYRSR